MVSVIEPDMENGGPRTTSKGGKSRGKGKRWGRGGGGSNGAGQRAMNRRDHWANQLCTPEWMLTVPNDLNGARSAVGAGEPVVYKTGTAKSADCTLFVGYYGSKSPLLHLLREVLTACVHEPRVVGSCGC